MKISKLADYASLILVCLSDHSGRHVSAHTIAVETHLPLPTVSKLLKQLLGTGLISSTRGPKGGYRLSVPVDEISLVQIVEAIDGPIQLTPCVQPMSCHLQSHCQTSTIWQLAQSRIYHALASIHLSAFNKANHTVALPIPDVSQYTRSSR